MALAASERSIEIGVDIGGTFTDIVCRETGGAMHVIKVPTTRNDPSEAVLHSIAELARALGDRSGAEIARFTHGTTVATNAVLERKGARIGLITTEASATCWRSARQMRTQVYRVMLEPETPAFLAPRRVAQGGARTDRRDGRGAGAARRRRSCVRAAD